MLVAAFAPASRGTPPDPPARIVVVDREVKIAVTDGRGELTVPIRLAVGESLKRLHVTASLTPLGGKKEAAGRRDAEKIYDADVQIDREKPAAFSVPVPIRAPGRYELEIKITGATESGGFSDRWIRHVVPDGKGGYRLVAPEAAALEEVREREAAFREQLRRDPRNPQVRLLFGETAALPKNAAERIAEAAVPRDKQVLARPAGLSERLKQYVKERAGKDARPDPITVHGRFTFLDFDGNWKPAVNVAIHLWDEDTFGDEHLGATVTDWNGFWSFTVDNDDGWFQDGRDIYYTAKLHNNVLRVEPNGGDAYEWRSTVHGDLNDGTVLDFGTETAGNNPTALQIWNTLNIAWNFTTTVGGGDPGFTDCIFPASATQYQPGSNAINIRAADNDGPDGITHEFGHAIMQHAYGTNISPGGAHNFGQCNQNKSLSWSEGWATGFMLAVRPDGTYNWHEGDGGRAIEAFSSSCRLGETSEGWVAAALLDMLDASNDDNGGDENRGRNKHGDTNAGSSVALATVIRNVMWGNTQNDFLQFWNALAGELEAAQRSQCAHIMYYNWMSVLDPDACAATRLTTRDLAAQASVLQGLRAFRDHALKSQPAGRELIDIYYRNSPEIALLLLRDESARRDSLALIEHFSEMGAAATHHTTHKKFVCENPPVVPEHIRGKFEAVLALLEKRGSPELKEDLRRVAITFAAIKDLTFEELRLQIEAAKPAEYQRAALPVLNRGSKRALQSSPLKEQLAPDVRLEFPAPAN